MHASWRLMSPRDNVWNHLYRKFMKIISQAKGSIRWVTSIWCTSWFLCLKRWKFWRRRQQWTKNGRSSKSCQRGNWPNWRVQLHWWTFVISKRGVSMEVSKVQRSSCTPRWYCQGRCRLMRCIHRTGFVCVSNDGRKNNGCHSKATRMCSTRSRRSISLQPSQNGGRSRVHSQMSRYMDTSSMTHVAQMWFFLNEIKTDIHLLVSCGRDSLNKVWTSSIGIEMGKSTELGMLIRKPCKRTLKQGFSTQCTLTI